MRMFPAMFRLGAVAFAISSEHEAVSGWNSEIPATFLVLAVDVSLTLLLDGLAGAATGDCLGGGLVSGGFVNWEGTVAM